MNKMEKKCKGNTRKIEIKTKQKTKWKNENEKKNEM